MCELGIVSKSSFEKRWSSVTSSATVHVQQPDSQTPRHADVQGVRPPFLCTSTVRRAMGRVAASESRPRARIHKRGHPKSSNRPTSVVESLIGVFLFLRCLCVCACCLDASVLWYTKSKYATPIPATHHRSFVHHEFRMGHRHDQNCPRLPGMSECAVCCAVCCCAIGAAVCVYCRSI